MGSTWVKIDDTFPDHPKVVGLTDAALACWLRGLCYSSRHLTDGELPAAALRHLGTAKAVRELVSAGLWLERDGGWQVHDYDQYQRTRADVERERERARQRKAKSRQSHADVTCDTPDSHAGVTEPEAEAEAETEKNSPSPPTRIDAIIEAVFAKVLGEKQMSGERISSVSGFRKWWDANELEGCRIRAQFILDNYDMPSIGHYADATRSPRVPPWAASMRREHRVSA